MRAPSRGMRQIDGLREATPHLSHAPSSLPESASGDPASPSGGH